MLAILRALGERGRPVSLTALADSVHLPKSTTLRFLRSLEPDGWIVRNNDGHYVIGPAVIALANQYLSSDPVLMVAPPMMRDLRDALGETISLSRVMGLERTCLQEFPSLEPLRLVLGVGSVGPLHAGASGLLLLAHLSAEVRREVYEAGLPRYTSTTLTEPAALEEECAVIRERGWAITHGQKTAGGIAIAVPVSDPNAPGSVSALGIFGPQARFDRDHDEQRWREALQECAAALEHAGAVHLRGERPAT
jgi:IclR family transcriptional regulator, acetate operon repressor